MIKRVVMLADYLGLRANTTAAIDAGLAELLVGRGVAKPAPRRRKKASARSASTNDSADGASGERRRR